MQYRKLHKHPDVWWLSLESVIDRTFMQYPGLKSSLLSESNWIAKVWIPLPPITDETNDRFQRLKQAYTQPLTEVYLLFYQSVLQIFDKFLQSVDPIILVVWDQAGRLVKQLVGKLVMVELIKKAGSDITSVDYSIEKQLQSYKSTHGQFNILQIMTCILAFLPSSTCESLKMMVTLLQLKLKLPIGCMHLLYQCNRLHLNNLLIYISSLPLNEL